MSSSTTPPSLPPPSSPLRREGHFFNAGQMRSYSDDAALARVWNRLESRRRRSLSSRPLLQGFKGVALLAAGIMLGVFIERDRVDEGSTQLASSEIIIYPRAPAGSVTESTQGGQLPALVSDEESVEKQTPSRRLKARRLAASQRRIHKIVPPSSPSSADNALAASVDIEALAVFEDLPPAEDNQREPHSVEIEQPVRASWLELADRGEFAAAFQRLDESGGFDAVLSAGSSEELMAVVEVARFVGQQGRAIQALKVVTRRHDHDPNAPLAAMILGNLLSRAGDAAGAAEAYALNRSLSPGGDFAEDALVREFDMAAADGDLSLVERLRAQYEAEFPDGRHSEDMRAEEARLRALVAAQPVDRSTKKEKGVDAEPPSSKNSAEGAPQSDEAPRDVQPTEPPPSFEESPAEQSPAPSEEN